MASGWRTYRNLAAQRQRAVGRALTILVFVVDRHLQAFERVHTAAGLRITDFGLTGPTERLLEKSR